MFWFADFFVLIGFVSFDVLFCVMFVFAWCPYVFICYFVVLFLVFAMCVVAACLR